ncbi:hypothetical protein L1987_24755 [Smallanthus sonchifolius]|uniref:Uncharacterized protein n=1 Tax=Smallanthus sonchifolius TaxID=185202 RepID=A0ACB9IKL3_9ASTR|nr:hypothetical protein L1987_24755 [Smallanthus sonchifolius]
MLKLGLSIDEEEGEEDAEMPALEEEDHDQKALKTSFDGMSVSSLESLMNEWLIKLAKRSLLVCRYATSVT